MTGQTRASSASDPLAPTGASGASESTGSGGAPPATGKGQPDLVEFIPATVGALLVGAIYLAVPAIVTIGPSWLLLALEVLLIAPRFGARLAGRRLDRWLGRSLTYALLVVLTLALISSLYLLVHHLPDLKPINLLTAGALLWCSNVLIFASWYWEVDGDGPTTRHRTGHRAADFQFPQQQSGNPSGWRPGFVDYLFLAFCTATALSPADTMPLTPRAKLLMMVEALISMLVLLLLIARFVNVV